MMAVFMRSPAPKSLIAANSRSAAGRRRPAPVAPPCRMSQPCRSRRSAEIGSAFLHARRCREAGSSSRSRPAPRPCWRPRWRSLRRCRQTRPARPARPAEHASGVSFPSVRERGAARGASPGRRAVFLLGRRNRRGVPPPGPPWVPPIGSAPIRIPLDNDGCAMAARQPTASRRDHQDRMDPRRSFQALILTLQNYWADYGCVILQPYDMEVGAGTFHPATTLRALGPKPWNAAYVQPSRRPKDGRYGENPNRLQHYYQFQVILKPNPPDLQDLYLKSLYAIGIDPKLHDIRFVEDDWESPTLGAWGLGWECWCDGM